MGNNRIGMEETSPRDVTSSPATESALPTDRIGDRALDLWADYALAGSPKVAQIEPRTLLKIIRELQAYRRPPVASPAGRGDMNDGLAAGAAPNPQDTQSPPATRANARQLDGWVIEAEVRTKTGILTWGFFESRGAAEQEASRFDLRALPATLILPPEAKIDDD